MCTRSGNRCNVDVLSTKMILETISVKVNLFGEISSVWQKFYSLWPFLIVLAKFWTYFGDFSLLWMAKYWTKLPPSYHADVRDFFYTHELDETDQGLHLSFRLNNYCFNFGTFSFIFCLFEKYHFSEHFTSKNIIVCRAGLWLSW